MTKMIDVVRKRLSKQLFRYAWRRGNKHNSTYAVREFPRERVTVGRKTYGPLNIIWMASSDTRVMIGNYCSIGPDVVFLVGGEHNYKRISTFPFQTKVYRIFSDVCVEEEKSDYSIIVEDDVWIGYNALVLSGVKIGKGSVIGARSIVTKDVPPYSIYIGNRIVKQRFSDDIVRRLMNIDYSTINHCENDDYRNYCQVEINEENVDDVLNSFVK